MRILPIAAVLALLGSAAVAQTDAPKGYIGAYGPDAPDRAFGGPVPDYSIHTFRKPTLLQWVSRNPRLGHRVLPQSKQVTLMTHIFRRAD